MEKVSENRSTLTNVSPTQKLSPDAEAKVRGRLGFAQSLLFGEYGRAMLNDFALRQYSRGNAPLAGALLKTVQWRLDTLGVSFLRELAFGCPDPVLIYTDAHGAGHVATVVFRGSARAVGMRHAHVPFWTQRPFDADKRIFEYELSGVAFGVTIAVRLLPWGPHCVML